jgi:hypothetical protein
MAEIIVPAVTGSFGLMGPAHHHLTFWHGCCIIIQNKVDARIGERETAKE